MPRVRKSEEEKKLVAKEACKRWRRSPRGRKLRYELRQAYYDRTTYLSEGKKRRWDASEVQILTEWDGSDEELAHFLGRSVHAIQKMRYLIKKGLR